MKTSTNAIAKRCVRPSHGTPHNGSRPNEQWHMWERIPAKIRRMYGPSAFKLWYDKEPGEVDG